MWLLSHVQDENGEGLTNEEIKAHADMFMFAGESRVHICHICVCLDDEASLASSSGHDTTASALSWIFYNLAMHQDHQDRCRAEIRSVLGDGDEHDISWSEKLISE